MSTPRPEVGLGERCADESKLSLLTYWLIGVSSWLFQSSAKRWFVIEIY